MSKKKTEKIKLPESDFKSFFLKAALVLVLITTAIYFKSLNNKLTNWDDEYYVTNNTGIRTLHGDSVGYTVKKAFTGYVMGNYHPITMLSYAVEYAQYKLNPKPYHVTNLIIHLLNSLLVLYFIWLLTQQQITAFIVALLFAIHPMHVESVAWVSERKDVLYTFFSLAALCDYTRYTTEDKRKQFFYIASLFMFLLALLSKAMAVCIPLIFILIDYYKGRKVSVKTILEKTPDLLISLTFGIVAIFAQKSLNALEDVAVYNFFDRILFSCYGILMYIWKMILPINLSCFYSYPYKENGLYPAIFYLSPLIVGIITFIIYKKQKENKDLIFGFLFFLVSIVLVLQILPVGGAIIAERYTYIPYIGLFFIIGRWINDVYENPKHSYHTYKNSIVASLAIVIITFSVLAYKRTKVWENSIALWTDAIEKYDKAPRSYSHRAHAYYDLKQFDKAAEDYSRYTLIKNDNSEIYYNRGLCYFELKKYNEAITDFNSAIKLKPNYIEAYYNRGIIYDDLNKYDLAIKDYSEAIKLDPNHDNALYNRARTYYLAQRFQLALNDILKAQKLGHEVEPQIIEAIKFAIEQAKK